MSITTAPAALYSQHDQHDRQVATWLLFCTAVVFGMILLGGVTRLTHSGLSMVEWRPLMGVIPPLSEEAWLATFDKYKQFPEYQKVNKGMSLDAFKVIFMYEYLHRVLGRMIGLIFFFPLVYFALRQRIRPGVMPHLVALLVLGGLQGLLGWYMVKSGLVDNPRVSQYRLTAHLGVAVAIYVYLLWLALDLLFTKRRSGTGGSAASHWPLLWIGLVFLMILSGGLVAGTRAGLAYPTWPLMGDSFVPPGLYGMTPFWLSAFEDVTTIQFNHRVLAYGVFLLLNLYAWRVYRSAPPEAPARRGALLLAVTLWMQVGLGIATLLLHVPVPLAAAHQGGAILLLTVTVYVCHVQIKRRAAVIESPSVRTNQPELQLVRATGR
ncbi:MAG: COX15/CtaA family protein [Pseudomonadota bacterium]